VEARQTRSELLAVAVRPARHRLSDVISADDRAAYSPRRG
jgi:hypothetical protein